jgi:Protein of unknown function (DUF2591)
MKIKTSELTGAALDLEVAKCEATSLPAYSYSTNWLFGGPIIEREGLTITYMGCDFENEWKARLGNGHWQGKDAHGPTPLIAAMRCYVASKLGNEVEIPDGLA